MNIEDLQLEVRKFVPEDGDVLVLKHSGRLTLEARRYLSEYLLHLRDRLQKRLEFIVLDDGLELEILKTSQLADLRPQVAA